MYTDEKGRETFYDAIANTGTAAFTAMVYTEQELDLGLDVLNAAVNDPSDITKYAAGAATFVAGFRALQNYSHVFGKDEEREQHSYEKYIDRAAVGTVGYGFYGVLGKTVYDNFDRIKEYLGGIKEFFTSKSPDMESIVAENLTDYSSDADFVREIYADVVSGLPEGAEQLCHDVEGGFEYVADHPVEASMVGGLLAASYLARKGVTSRIKRKRHQERVEEIKEEYSEDI